jgi:hypothetical protein
MRRKIDLLILFIVLAIGGIGVWKAQAIGDWVHALRYSPPAEVSALAEGAGMSELGTKLFYRFSPEIVDLETIKQNCIGERLGCIEGQSIYILQANNESEVSRNMVTAAHEMLHVAYDRLGADEISRLEPLLDAELKRPRNAEVAVALNGYSPEDYYNEAHSFVGSQLSDIDPGLETHYARYFSDRSKSIHAYEISPEH